jgi:hypothetical protein
MTYMYSQRGISPQLSGTPVETLNRRHDDSIHLLNLGTLDL